MMHVRVTAFAAAVSVLAAMVAASSSCSSFGDAEDETPAPTADAGASDATAADAPSADAPTVDADIADAVDQRPFCERNPGHDLCDDFQDEVLEAPHWVAPVPAISGLPAGAVTIAGKGAGVLDPVLRVNVPDVSDAGSGAVGFLRHDIGDPPANIEFVFTMNLQGFGKNDYVELATIYAVGTNLSVGIALDRDRLRVISENETATDLGIAPRLRQRLRVKLTPTNVTVLDKDGKTIGSLAIPSLMQRNDLRFGVGLVYTNGCSVGTIDIDDVLLDY